jgi:serine phosphatase RsbU (regulator of sigma subunit)
MDCTGHGVPGALMSTLGMTLLNEIVLAEKTYMPDQILEKLRTKLIAALGQKGYGTIKDGIEGAICCFDSGMNQFRYSGSCNSMILIHQGVIKDFKPKKIPIGYSEKVFDFETVSFDLTKDDMIYMFSDGYVDQFGRPKSKKYLKRRFKETLLSNHRFPIAKQKEILLSEFSSWKGEEEQTDDVLVVGIRV